MGTRDVLPPESSRWEALIARFAGGVERAGYGLVQSPMFEDIGVFQRVGEGTDVVRKEMYDFHDKGDRHLALRPEGTASIVRAYVQHRPVTPWKVFYAAPSFRYERPQAGRLRQHHQLGVEVLGSRDPDLDVEVIALGWDHLASLGLTQVRLLINSMGTRADRAAYVATVQAWLAERRDVLDPADAAKVDDHPMRVLDSKREATRALVADAPSITESLSSEAADHFARVLDGLDALEIPYERTPTLVRGLDYYTHTTFEIVSDALDAAQSTILGGGRYDGLVAEMGGPDTPGVGFGSGIERVLLACDAEGVFPLDERVVDVFVVDTTGGAEATRITTELRRAGISADRAFDGRSMRAQMKVADRSGAAMAVIVGPDELSEEVASLRVLRGPRGNDEAQSRIPRHQLIHALQITFGDDATTNEEA
ncbi:MAG TPA: histidine--tRNA ligase [Acidimicrobiales bacterium]|nr:histidine--tRNA ligase [Acidimicrobiales bacterium]